MHAFAAISSVVVSGDFCRRAFVGASSTPPIKRSPITAAPISTPY